MSGTLDPTRSRHARRLAALPDAAMSGWLLTVWIAPLTFGAGTVRNALLAVIIEFFVMHATGFVGATALDSDTPARKRALAQLGMGVFYAGFLALLVAAFGEWWPVITFVWLASGKFAGVLAARDVDAGNALRMRSESNLSILLYVAGALATLFVSVPPLGMTEAVRPLFGLGEHDLWVREPQRVVAFGVLYFASMAWLRWWGRLGVFPPPRWGR